MAKMRSPNYPAAGLGPCIGWARLLWGKEKRTQVSPADAAKAIGYGGLHGPARSALSAMKKFGLLNEVKDNVQLSDRAMAIIHHAETDDAYRIAVREAALSPDIFRELLDTHAEASDDALKSHLIVRKGFTDEGARQFIRAFRDTMEIAKLPDSGYDASMIRSHGEANMEREVAGSGMLGMTRVVPARGESRGHSIASGETPLHNSRSFPIPLKRQNEVTLTFSRLPVDKDDIQKLKSWIDLMGENLTEATEETPVEKAFQDIFR